MGPPFLLENGEIIMNAEQKNAPGGYRGASFLQTIALSITHQTSAGAAVQLIGATRIFYRATIAGLRTAHCKFERDLSALISERAARVQTGIICAPAAAIG